MVVFNFLLEYLNDDFALDRLVFIDGQPPMVMEKIRELELGNSQDVRFQ